jgi:phage terminase large subunit-like protein
VADLDPLLHLRVAAHKASGLRRFRVLFVVVPRKNGKSALSAGIGLYMLCADGEFGAEVYSGATSEKQAWEVFKPARLMAMRTPALCAKFGVDVNARSLVRVDDESKFETITGDPGDGQSPSCSIHDEYHEHADDGQVETMHSGMGARDQPLQVKITTAGDNLAGPCYADLLDERQKLGADGRPADRRRDLLRRVHDRQGRRLEVGSGAAQGQPNFGISVGADYLLARQRDAIALPRKAGVFKTKHLNLWVSPRRRGSTSKPGGAAMMPRSRSRRSTRPCSSGCAAAAASPGSTLRRRSTSPRSSC